MSTEKRVHDHKESGYDSNVEDEDLERMKEYYFAESTEVRAPPPVNPPPIVNKTFFTQPSLLDQFRKNASPYHMFDLPPVEEEEVRDGEDEDEDEDEGDDDDEVEVKKPKFSFLDRLRSIRETSITQENKKTTEPTETEYFEDSFIPITLPNLSIHSPFANPPDPRLPPGTILHNEIEALYDFIVETELERKSRQSIIDNFSRVIKEIYPSAKTSTYGSFLYHLMLPGSDIDLQVEMKNPEGPKSQSRTRETTKDILFNIQNRMTRSGIIREGSQVIVGARIPILSCREFETGQPIDISLNLIGNHIIFKNPTSIAQKNAELILSFCHKYPAYRILVLILKLFLRQRCMNNVHFGGLSSFGLCLLVMSFFQHNDLLHGTKTDRKKLSLGILLVDFLALFGEHFNYRDVAIDVRKEGKFIRKRDIQRLEGRDRGDNLKLYILNPNQQNHIVTSGTTKMDLIRRVFKSSFLKLTAPKTSYQHLGNRILPRIIRIHDDLLKRASFYRSKKMN